MAKRFNNIIWDALALDRQKARREAEKFMVQIASLVSATMFYRWMFGVFVSILLAVGGTLGTILLVKQNEKLSEQTEEARKQNTILSNTFLHDKSEEISKLFKEISLIKSKLTYGDKRSIAQTYTNTIDTPCVPKEINSIDTSSNDWRFDIEQLSIAAEAALRGAASSESYDYVRSRLLRTLAISGISFSVFSSNSFSNVDLKNINLFNANLDGANLYNADLTQANLDRLCAVNLRLAGAKAHATRFSNSRIINPYFWNADFSYASFSDAQIYFTKINGQEYWFDYDDTYHDRKEHPTLIDWLVYGWKRFSRLISSSPTEDVWTVIGYADPKLNTFSDTILIGVEFNRARLGNLIFDASNLQKSSFNDAIFTAPNSFRDANLSYADFRLANKSSEYLEESDFRGTIFKNTVLDGLDFGNNASLTTQQLKSGCVCKGPAPKFRGKDVELAKCLSVAEFFSARRRFVAPGEMVLPTCGFSLSPTSK